MTTVLDDKLPATALALLAKYGTSATFTVESLAYAAATGITTPTTTAAYALKISPPAPYSQGLVDGELIRSDDLRTTLAASGLAFTPYIGQKVTFDGKVWSVQEVRPLRSGDLVAAYELRLRR